MTAVDAGPTFDQRPPEGFAASGGQLYLLLNERFWSFATIGETWVDLTDSANDEGTEAGMETWKRRAAPMLDVSGELVIMHGHYLNGQGARLFVTDVRKFTAASTTWKPLCIDGAGVVGGTAPPALVGGSAMFLAASSRMYVFGGKAPDPFGGLRGFRCLGYPRVLWT